MVWVQLMVRGEGGGRKEGRNEGGEREGCESEGERSILIFYSSSSNILYSIIGHFYRKTVVGSTTAKVESGSNVSTLIGERKTSNILLPSYSELELKANEADGPPRRRQSKEGLLSEQEQGEQDYANLCYDQDYQNLQQPHPHVRRSSLPTIVQQGEVERHQLPIPDGEPHTVISISPGSEESGSPSDSAPNTTKVNANANSRPGTLTPIQDESPWYQTSTPSMMSHDYSSPASPTNGSVFHPINPSGSHKSLQLSFSNPVSARNNQTHSMVGQAGVGFSRSSHSMGRSGAHSGRHASQSSGKVHSIPAGMDHFTDV